MPSPTSAIAGQDGLAYQDNVDSQQEQAAFASRRLSHAAEDEQFTALLHGLPWTSAHGAEPLKTVGFTSCLGGEGVSTVAVRLAVRAAELGGRNVLMVDANLARPAVERMLGLPRGAGLSDVLLENCQRSTAIRPTHLPRLRMLSAGDPTIHPDEVFDPARIAELVAALKDEFDLVIFDLPPAGEAVSAACIARLLDGVVLVVEAQRTPWEIAQRVTQHLGRAHARLLGAVLNRRL